MNGPNNEKVNVLHTKMMIDDFLQKSVQYLHQTVQFLSKQKSLLCQKALYFVIKGNYNIIWLEFKLTHLVKVVTNWGIAHSKQSDKHGLPKATG